MRMKKLAAMSLLVTVLLAGCSNSAVPQESSSAPMSSDVQSGEPDAAASATVSEGSAPDSVASASRIFYQDSSLDLEGLAQAIANGEGGCTIATVNADGTPNLIVAVPGMTGDTLIFNWADNVTKENVQREGTAMVSYYLYDKDAAEKGDRNRGARMVTVPITDPQERAALQSQVPDRVNEGTTLLKVVELLPLG